MRLSSSSPLPSLTMGGVSAFWCLTVSVCALGARQHVAASTPAGPVVIGEVALVDAAGRFVLIDLDSNLCVPPGASLRTTNATGGTGRLLASPEEERPFVAADIVAGHPAVGDQVLR
jgi:hypothetical protein